RAQPAAWHQARLPPAALPAAAGTGAVQSVLKSWVRSAPWYRFGADHTRLARIVQQALERSVTCLGRSFLRGVVDMDEAEALVVALGPFVVVEQRPGKIAAHIGACGPGGEHGLEVVVVISDAARIIVALDLGHAVLGDIYRDFRVVAGDA